jgi:hypothetical protein
VRSLYRERREYRAPHPNPRNVEWQLRI